MEFPLFRIVQALEIVGVDIAALDESPSVRDAHSFVANPCLRECGCGIHTECVELYQGCVVRPAPQLPRPKVEPAPRYKAVMPSTTEKTSPAVRPVQFSEAWSFIDFSE